MLLGRTWILMPIQMSGVRLITCPSRIAVHESLEILGSGHGTTGTSVEFCLEGVTLPPFALRCRFFYWCNSKLHLWWGKQQIWKGFHLAQQKSPMLHLLLIKCYHCPAKIQDHSGHSIASVVPLEGFPSSRSSPHLSRARSRGPKHRHGALGLLQQGLQGSAIAQHLPVNRTSMLSCEKNPPGELKQILETKHIIYIYILFVFFFSSDDSWHRINYQQP